MLGDCLEAMTLIEEDSVDLLFTDPPYGHANHDGDLNSHTNKNRGLTDQPIANDAAFWSTLRLLGDVLDVARPAFKRDSAVAIMSSGGGPHPCFADVIMDLKDRGLRFDHTVIWNKLNHGLGWRYRRGYEMIHVAHRDDGRMSWHRGKREGVNNIINLAPAKQREHPNEKPFQIPLYFIQNHAPAGGFVVDPFMGSGSTGVACARSGRRFFGVDCERRWFDLACRNVERAALQPLINGQRQMTLGEMETA